MCIIIHICTCSYFFDTSYRYEYMCINIWVYTDIHTHIDRFMYTCMYIYLYNYMSVDTIFILQCRKKRLQMHAATRAHPTCLNHACPFFWNATFLDLRIFLFQQIYFAKEPSHLMYLVFVKIITFKDNPW